MTPLTALILILIVHIVAYTVILLCTFVPWSRGKKKEEPEIDIDKQAKTASYTIAEYCLCQVDEGHCIFNRNEKNVDGCNCKLMDDPPEAWRA